MGLSHAQLTYSQKPHCASSALADICVQTSHTVALQPVNIPSSSHVQHSLQRVSQHSWRGVEPYSEPAKRGWHLTRMTTSHSGTMTKSASHSMAGSQAEFKRTYRTSLQPCALMSQIHMPGRPRSRKGCLGNLPGILGLPSSSTTV